MWRDTTIIFWRIKNINTPFANDVASISSKKFRVMPEISAMLSSFHTKPSREVISTPAFIASRTKGAIHTPNMFDAATKKVPNNSCQRYLYRYLLRELSDFKGVVKNKLCIAKKNYFCGIFSKKGTPQNYYQYVGNKRKHISHTG